MRRACPLLNKVSVLIGLMLRLPKLKKPLRMHLELIQHGILSSQILMALFSEILNSMMS